MSECLSKYQLLPTFERHALTVTVTYADGKQTIREFETIDQAVNFIDSFGRFPEGKGALPHVCKHCRQAGEASAASSGLVTPELSPTGGNLGLFGGILQGQGLGQFTPAKADKLVPKLGGVSRQC